jgi:phosphoribosylformimino-5-aminoimidazole carboxamide ribotide isomerase
VNAGLPAAGNAGATRLLPVIDLRQGQVVRGVAGRRAEYRPIKSRIAATPDPGAVATAFAQLGLREVYVADLDAIGGQAPDWSSYQRIAEAGLQLWVDAGVADHRAADRLSRRGEDCVTRIVAGLESLESATQLQTMLGMIGGQRLVFSLDLWRGQPLGPSRGWRSSASLDVACEAVERGVSSVIILELSRVGVPGGPGTGPLCRALRNRFHATEIISGGGVRHNRDVRHLLDNGCDRVMVASALHNASLRVNHR